MADNPNFISKNKKVLFLVVGVLIVGALIFAVVFLGKGKTAGRAIFTGEDATVVQGDAGFSGDIATLVGQPEFDFTVGAILGEEHSVAYSFRLRYPDSLEVGEVTTPQDQSWQMGNEEFRRITNENNILQVEHATLNVPEAITGNVPNLATVHFRVKEGSEPLTGAQIQAGDLEFEQIVLLSLDSGENIVQNIKQPSGEVVVPPPAGGGEGAEPAECPPAQANRQLCARDICQNFWPDLADCAGLIDPANCPPAGPDCPPPDVLPGARGEFVGKVTNLLRGKEERITPKERVELIVQLGGHLSDYFTQAVVEDQNVAPNEDQPNEEWQ